MSYSSFNTVSTVASREIKVATRSKPIIISLAIALIAVVAGIIATSFFADGEDEPARIGVVGVEAPVVDAATQALGPDPGVIAEPMTGSREDAVSQVKNEDVTAVLLKTDAGFDLITSGDGSPEVMGAASTITSTMAQGQALQTLGISAEQFARAMPPAAITTIDVEDGDASEANLPAVVMVMIGSSLMSFFIILFAANIGGRVTEEKSSRVVEIILSTVRPLDFLAGKILGNTIFGLVATAVILGVGAIAIKASHLLEGFPFDYGILGLLLLAFVLGMLLFGSLYAAAGAMVSRTEDLQSTQMPVMILIFGMIYTPLFGWNSLDSTVMQVLTWIPPFSLPAIPLQVASGNMSYPLALAAYAVSAVVIVLLMALVAKIYQRSILHNGKKMSWAKALTAKS